MVGCEGKAIMRGMDASAVSPLWYSKYVRTGRESERRVWELKELTELGGFEQTI